MKKERLQYMMLKHASPLFVSHWDAETFNIAYVLWAEILKCSVSVSVYSTETIKLHSHKKCTLKVYFCLCSSSVYVRL